MAGRGRPRGRVGSLFEVRPMLKLKAARLAAGLNQTQAGQAIGVNKAHYGKFEAGVVRLDLRRGAILASLYGCTVDSMID